MAEDTQITCVDCSNDFTFTAQEQAFYAEKNFTQPKRCKPCREIRKANGSGNSNQSPLRGDRHGNDRKSLGERKLYDAVCTDCKAKTQVPFKPMGDRPVYCRDCFAAQRR